MSLPTPPRALVTGGAGFVGSHLVDRLSSDGVEVLVVDDFSTGRASNLSDAIRVERLDIATMALGHVFRAWRPDVVYHLAAQASVPRSIEDPDRDLAVNVVGTHRVGEAARDAGAARLLFVSSGGAIYGEATRPATEHSRPAPTSYYGFHKLAAEGHVAIAGLPYIVARPSNLYGPRQASGLDGAVVAGFVEQALSAGRLRIHGDGTQTRDFLDVRDAVDALVRLGRDDAPVGVWNVARGRRVSVARLADLVEESIGRPIVRDHAPRRVGDVMHSSVSAARLRRLGWRPRLDLASGVRELIDLGRRPTGVA